MSRPHRFLWVEKYDEDFACVGQRYDEPSRTRINTVEIIVERKLLPASPRSHKNESLVAVQTASVENKRGKMARSAGGIWDPDVKLWFIKYGNIVGTELEKHIILDKKSNQPASNII